MKLLFAVLMLSFPFGCYAQSDLFGDVNRDGEVNILDVDVIIGVILGNYHVENIVGSWVSVYGVDDGVQYDVVESDVVRFDFYGDHTGRYTFCSGPDVSSSIGLRWELNDQRLEIWYDDDEHENLYYRIDKNGYLLLSVDSQFGQYTAYSPVSNDNTVGSEIISIGRGVN